MFFVDFYCLNRCMAPRSITFTKDIFFHSLMLTLCEKHLLFWIWGNAFFGTPGTAHIISNKWGNFWYHSQMSADFITMSCLILFFECQKSVKNVWYVLVCLGNVWCYFYVSKIWRAECCLTVYQNITFYWLFMGKIF